MKYIVYITINKKAKINGINRRFLGVHKVTSDSFDGYLGDGVNANLTSTYMYPKTPFQYAVKKYGVKSFVRKTLFTYETAKEAYTKYNELVNSTFTSEYYNLLPITYSLPIYQFDLTGKLRKVWDTLEDCSDFYSYGKERFITYIKAKRPFLKSYWSYSKTLDTVCNVNTPNIIFIYNRDGKLLREFISYKECAEYLNITEKYARTHPLVNNLYWISNKLSDLYSPKIRSLYKSAIFYVYTEDKFIGKYKGKEVMNVIKLHSWAKIHNIVNSTHWYDNFYIATLELSELPKRHTSTILVYNKYGELIESSDSFEVISTKYNIPKHIVKRIKQGNRYFGDYIFKYSK